MPDIVVSPIAIAALAVIVALVLVAFLYAKNYVKVPPNQVGVFTGRGKLKVVRGGARFKMPIIERVDFMSLEPFNIEVQVNNVYSMNGVPVNVTAVGLIRFGSTDEMISTAVERFLTSDRASLHSQVREIVAGNMRGIVSQMTVEDLNSKRDEFTLNVVTEAEKAFQPIGMQLDVLTIQNISDDNGYLDALGQTRTAEVQRDAAIGRANAERDSMIQSAAADREGKTAQAEAATAIAQAEQERDIELARISANVERERATAEQSGPLAQAEARKAVVVAETDVERQQEQARIAVEEQRGLRAEKAQRADVIVPAEARRQAEVIEAEGEREAAIAKAQAAAEARTLAGRADADARKDLAAAKQVEMEAEAAGQAAGLKAQAEGQRELAEALNAFTPEATRLQILPQVIATMPEMAQAIAAQIGQIGNMVVIQSGGSGEGEDTVSKLATLVPAGMAAVAETVRAVTGMDVSQLTGNDAQKDISIGEAAASSEPTSVPPSTEPSPEDSATE